MFENLEQIKHEFETEVLNSLDYSLREDDETFFCDDSRLEILGNGSFRTVFIWDKYPMYVVKAQRTNRTNNPFDMYVDYGAAESFIYDRAKEKGIEWAFAETHWIGEDETYIYYLMERCDCDEVGMSSTVEGRKCAMWVEDEDRCNPEEDMTRDELVSYYYDNISEGEPQPEDCVDYAIEAWDNEGYDGYEVKAFLDALNINDLHAGNWGYRRGTNELVMVDYGGYNHNIVEEQMA